MLTRWTLSNFKAFGHSAELALSPVTLFMGANSSGKSTIIQTILLIKQTLQYAAPDKPLALNGPLLRLGDFNDVVSNTSTSRTFSLEWTVAVSEPDSSELEQTRPPFGPITSYLGSQSDADISTALTFGPATTSTTSQQSAVEV
jgi:hypothetical protein